MAPGFIGAKFNPAAVRRIIVVHIALVNSGATMLTRRCLVSAFVTGGLSIGAVRPAVSQAYPSRPVTIVSAFVPGGANDLLARLIAQRLQRVLGKTSWSKINRVRVATSARRPSPDPLPMDILLMGLRCSQSIRRFTRSCRLTYCAILPHLHRRAGSERSRRQSVGSGQIR